MGANHLETMTFVQMQNHSEIKIYTLLLYTVWARGKDFGVIWSHIGRLRKNCTCSIQY